MAGENIVSLAAPATHGQTMSEVRRGFSGRVYQILERVGLARAMGLSFDGKRDLWTAFGWDKNISVDMLMDMYMRGGIAKRIIDAKPESTWGRPPKLYMPDQPDWTTAFYKLAWDLDLWSTFKKVDILAGLGRYAILVIGTNRGGAMHTPLNVRGGAGQLKITYLQPYSEIQARIDEWDTNPLSPRFGKPEMYTILANTVKQLNTGTSEVDVRPQGQSFKIHHSRVIHVARGGLTNAVFGIPEYAPIWNYLCDLMKVTGASSESYWRVAYPGLHADVDKDMDLDEEDEANLSTEFDEFQHDMRRIMRTRGVTVKDIGSKVADPRGAFDVLVTLISGTVGTPKRILLGSEAGQLASSQDKASWAERIEEYRENHAEPNLIWPFVTWVMQHGVLPFPATAEIQLGRCLWPDAYRMSPLERGQTAAQTARSLANIQKGLQPIILEEAEDEIPETPARTDPISGAETPAIPGRAGKPAVTAEPLLSREEARRILGLSNDQNLLANFPEDLG